MGSFKRAVLYITRKKKKSILMFFILFCIATAVLSGISIKKLHQLQDKIQVRRQQIHLRYKTIWQQISQEQCQRVW